jgi:hypothetical protein
MKHNYKIRRERFKNKKENIKIYKLINKDR